MIKSTTSIGNFPRVVTCHTTPTPLIDPNACHRTYVCNRTLCSGGEDVTGCYATCVTDSDSAIGAPQGYTCGYGDGPEHGPRFFFFFANNQLRAAFGHIWDWGLEFGHSGV